MHTSPCFRGLFQADIDSCFDLSFPLIRKAFPWVMVPGSVCHCLSSSYDTVIFQLLRRSRHILFNNTRAKFEKYIVKNFILVGNTNFCSCHPDEPVWKSSFEVCQLNTSHHSHVLLFQLPLHSLYAGPACNSKLPSIMDTDSLVFDPWGEMWYPFCLITDLLPGEDIMKTCD